MLSGFYIIFGKLTIYKQLYCGKRLVNTNCRSDITNKTLRSTIELSFQNIPRQ